MRLRPEERRNAMNNERLPEYPQHPEPTERIESAEFERESKPRVSPGMIVWMGLALMVGIYFAQKNAAEHLGGDQVNPAAPAKAKPQGN
jgi:hypothetical protein